MKIGIIGAGALGTFLGGILAKYNDVIMVGRRDLALDKIQIVGKTDIEVKVKYTTELESIKDRELLIICTKSYDTREAVEGLSKFLNKDAKVLSLQNGLNNEKIISDYVNRGNVIGGITGIGVTFMESGKVRHAGEGETIIGAYRHEKDDSIPMIADLLRTSGLEVSITDNIYGHIWKKVIINSSINPITALTGLKNGALIEIDHLHELMKKVCSESTTVAEEEVELPSDDILGETEKIVKLTAENRSSMLQDIDNRKKTEIDSINGAIISAGKKLGIETPYNQTLLSLVKGKEKGAH